MQNASSVKLLIATILLFVVLGNFDMERKTKNTIEYPAIRCIMPIKKREAILTAYTAGPESTNKNNWHRLYGITASGKKVKEWHTIAMDGRIPFGTKVYIPYFRYMPNGGWFVVEDRGGVIKLSKKPVGVHKVDVYMTSQQQAIAFGRRKLTIYIFTGGNIQCPYQHSQPILNFSRENQWVPMLFKN